jgi:CDP-6-deoxy-D-xylo-4-hexulose-3-dehydrase
VNPVSKRICLFGRVFDGWEIANLIDDALDFWLTAGKYAAQFEKELPELCFE